MIDRLRVPIAACLALPVLAGCWGEDWTAVTYYQAGRPAFFEVIGTYRSLDQCAAAGQKWVRDNGRPGMSSYRCGLNCEGEIVGGLLTNCEDTAT